MWREGGRSPVCLVSREWGRGSVLGCQGGRHTRWLGGSISTQRPRRGLWDRQREQLPHWGGSQGLRDIRALVP